MIEKRGRLDEGEVDRFMAAGFGADQALDVVGIVVASTITNYTASITGTPLEAMFQARSWTGS